MNRRRRIRCVAVHVDLCFIDVRSLRLSRLHHVDLSFAALVLVGSSLSSSFYFALLIMLLLLLLLLFLVASFCGKYTLLQI